MAHTANVNVLFYSKEWIWSSVFFKRFSFWEFKNGITSKTEATLGTKAGPTNFGALGAIKIIIFTWSNRTFFKYSCNYLKWRKWICISVLTEKNTKLVFIGCFPKRRTYLKKLRLTFAATSLHLKCDKNLLNKINKGRPIACERVTTSWFFSVPRYCQK